MDSFVTFRDLLEIGTFLISLASFITSLYYNHKNSNHKKKKKYPPLATKLWRLKLFNPIQWEQTVYWYALSIFIIRQNAAFVKGFFVENAANLI